MARRLSPLPPLLGLALAAAVGASPLCGATRAQGKAPGPAVVAPAVTPAAAPAPRPQPSAAQVEDRARAAAERILTALRNGDAASRYAQFAPSLRRMTTPDLVQSQIRRQPKVLGWRITAVEPGLDSSTVEATLQTSAGPRQLLMALDRDGLLEGYHFNVSDQPAEKVARDFVQAITEGRFVYASSFLAPDLQQEIPAASLQRKWEALQRLTGPFVRVRRVFRSEHTPDMKLVMVNTEFGRVTDNLYVILDSANEIIGVNFPSEPTPSRPER